MALISNQVNATTRNGFDLSTTTIDREEILSGGPPKDGIPAIDKPQFIGVDRVNFLQDDDIVISVTHQGTTRAYPTRVVVWHEVVNDSIEDFHFVVTYCPLCGTAMVFDRKIDNQVRSFGVSGLLYRSDVLLYDRATESLWSQLKLQAVSGALSGQQLIWRVSEHLTWESWREKYPDGQVLSTDTGYKRNYAAAAYQSYFASKKPMFPVPTTRSELAEKSWVIGVIDNGKAKAYPIDKLPKNKKLQDTFNGKTIHVSYNTQQKYPSIQSTQGEGIPSVLVFWFAWQAFYPDTELWLPSAKASESTTQ